MTQVCVNCGRSDDQIPLLGLTFKGEPLLICPQCLPVLIHQPEKLEGKLPGLDTQPVPHDDD